MSLGADIVACARRGELDTLQHELRRVDPSSVPDVQDLHAALLHVLLRSQEFDDDVRSELALAWLRVTATSSCVGELEQLRLHEAAIAGLDDPYWFVRASFAESLAYVGAIEHVPRLMAMFRDAGEHRTVRVDALESALANADDSRVILRDAQHGVDSEPSLFVRWMILLHGLLAETSAGPSTADLDAALDEDEGRWPPQETLARTLRAIAWAFSPDSSHKLQARIVDVIGWVEARDLDPLWVDLIEPARAAVASARD